MRLVVTGASGAVGRAVMPVLEQAADITAAGRGALRPTILAAGPDVVLHLAGGRADGTEAGMSAANLATTDEVVRAAAEVEPVPAVAVLGSSAELSGGDGLLGENAALEPATAYGRVKREQTDLALGLGAELGVHVAVLRLFNFVAADDGARDPVGNWRSQLLAGDVVECGDLTLVRDYVTPELLGGALTAFVSRRPPEPVVNVCTGRGTTGRRLLEAMAARHGRDLRVVHDPAFDRPDTPPSVVGDPSLMQRVLGPLPVPSLAGLAEAALGS